jgi:hypothetical protein
MYLDERSARGRDAAHEPTGDHPMVAARPEDDEEEEEAGPKSGTARSGAA